MVFTEQHFLSHGAEYNEARLDCIRLFLSRLMMRSGQESSMHNDAVMEALLGRRHLPNGHSMPCEG